MNDVTKIIKQQKGSYLTATEKTELETIIPIGTLLTLRNEKEGLDGVIDQYRVIEYKNLGEFKGPDIQGGWMCLCEETTGLPGFSPSRFSIYLAFTANIEGMQKDRKRRGQSERNYVVTANEPLLRHTGKQYYEYDKSLFEAV